VSYHYFFQDKDQQNLTRFKTLLLQQNYSIIGITKASGKYQLEVQKTEAHTAESVIERGKQLSILAKNNGIETFDGFELKSEENDIEADFSEEIEKTPVNQLFLLWTAVNRQSRSGKTIGPDERLTPIEGLRTITINGAYEYFEEATKGSIEPGKLADLVVLSDNPLTIDPQAIKDLVVLETIKEGKTIYKR